MRKVHIPQEREGERFDSVAAHLLGITRSQISKHIADGLITLDGEKAPAKRLVQADQIITYKPAATLVAAAVPDIPILYEDSDVLVIDKPAGLVVHPTESKTPQPTVAAFALKHGVVDRDTERAGIVHRLDKDTSGVMVIAKNEEVKKLLQDQFKQRTVEKTYMALVRGRLNQREAMIDLPINRSVSRPIKRAVTPGGREARTSYKVLREYPGASLVEITLHTGRTHQIRVHFSHIGHPVIGDALYSDGKKVQGLSRQFLHASLLSFDLPGGKRLSKKSPLPADLQAYLESIEDQV